jgi:hypothetical protein
MLFLWPFPIPGETRLYAACDVYRHVWCASLPGGCRISTSAAQTIRLQFRAVQRHRLPPNVLTHRITQRRLVQEPQHAVTEPVGDGTVFHPV